MLFGLPSVKGIEVFVSEMDLDEAAFEAAVKNATEDDEVAEEQADEPAADEPAQEPDDPAEDEPKADPEPEPEAAPAKPAGIASKDGKAVLPYAALKGARAETRRERELREQAEAERDALKQQLDDLRSGKEPEPDPLDELVEDFPAAKVLVEEVRALRQQVQVKVVPAAKAPADTSDDAVQDAIDAVPMLSEWQAADPEKWARATAIDNSLRESPKWKNKPLEARFQHVARMVADEFDIQTEEDEPSPAPRASRQDPDEVVKSARRAAPNTLSDFKSGSAAKSDNVERMSPRKQAAMVEQMSAAEFQDWLDKQG